MPTQQQSPSGFSARSIMPFGSSKKSAAIGLSSPFSPKELATLYKQFQRIAKNGVIDTETFRQSLGILGMVQDSLLCQRLFQVFNSSQSGFINFAEYAAGLGVLVKGTVDEKLDFAFRMADVDGSGQLTFEELVQMVQSIVQIYTDVMGEGYAAATLDRDKIWRMFNRMDKDHDGLVTMEEYVRGMKNHPEFVASLRGSDMFHSNESHNLLDSQSRVRHYEKVFKAISKEVDEAVELVTVIQNERDAAIAQSTRVFNDDEVTLTDDDFSDSDDEDNSIEAKGNEVEECNFDAVQSRHVQFTTPLKKQGNSSHSENNGTASSLKKPSNTSPFPKSPTKRFENLLMPSSIDDLASLLLKIKRKLHDPAPEVFAPKFPAETPVARMRLNSTSLSHLATPSPNKSPRKFTFSGTPHDSKTPEETWETKDHATEQTIDSPSAAARNTPQSHQQSDRAHARSSTDSRTDMITPRNLDDGALARFLKPSGKGGGSTVFFGHKNWDLVLNVMKGIQIATGRSGAETTRPIAAFDFTVKEKYTLVSGAHFRNEAMSHAHDDPSQQFIQSDGNVGGRSCRFVDYAPLAFNRLRAHFGISTKDYIHSIGPGNMLSDLMLGTLSTLSEVGSEGKSGSFFYFTSDGKFLVKTVHREEHKLLRHILPKYYQHMVSSPHSDDAKLPSNGHSNNSLLCRIVGCHVLRLGKHNKLGGRKIYLVVMVNLLNGLSKDMELHRRYDLKGSWVGRKSGTDSKGTMKDLDFINAGERIRLGPEASRVFTATIKHDASFLASMNLIDYSLLLGVHDKSKVQKHSEEEQESPTNVSSLQRSNSDCSSSSSPLPRSRRSSSVDRTPFFQRDGGGIESVDGKEVYVMGVIDFLTPYTSRKRCERIGKMALCKDPRGISVSPPAKYAHRFATFLENNCE